MGGSSARLNKAETMQHFLKTLRHQGAVFVLIVVSLLLAGPAMADPAGRIGRIAWISGPVQLQNSGAEAAEAAVLNRPLTSGDVLSTSAGGRAEIHIGSLKLRVDSGTVLALEQIDDERIRLRLDDGSVIVRLPSRDMARDVELMTRDGRFSTMDAGHYRFDFDGASSATTAYSGRLHFDAEDSALDVSAGQRAQFWNAGGTRYRLSVPADDSFANWSAIRDQARTGETYTRHVSPEMTGAGDLDAHGSWTETTEYGAVWYPRAVAADWVPYRSGRWVWIAPWGWNWVGDEPWGFAPFHYGRWVLHRQAWGWVPGARIARPVYAPAMVAWVGTANFSIAIGRGGAPTVGWFPLAPREVYVPAYRSSPTYVRQVNVTHVTNISNLTTIVNNPQTVVDQTRYRHRNEPRAVTMVAADVVRDRRPVAVAAIAHSDRSAIRHNPVRAEAPVAAPVAVVRAPAVREPNREQGVPSDDWRDGRERRVMSQPREMQDRPMPANVPVQPGVSASAANPVVTQRPAPSGAMQKAVETPPVREPAARIASPANPAPLALPPPSAGRVERTEPAGQGAPLAMSRPQSTVAQETRSTPMPMPAPTPNPTPAPVATPAAVPAAIPVGTAQRNQPMRSDALPAAKASEENSRRNEDNMARRMQREPRPEPRSEPLAQQPVQQTPVTRIDPVPPRAREIREERREPPREMQQSVRQPPQAPREVARPPEPRAEPRKEQREERREERRHPSRDEKPPTDSARPQEDPRRR
jgi:hypothetical protein